MNTTVLPDASFETLLRFLLETHGSDFTGYKRSSLMRRVRRRLEQLHLATFDDYIDYLEVHPDEHAVLLDTILINVTTFFRDAQAWDRLAAEVLPKIISSAQGDNQIRVWSTGCATGEEAYTVAILFAEALGPDAFRRQVKIYATDIDEEALSRARLGSYSHKELSAVPDALRGRYFENQGQRGSFVADLRRSVIFGRHDLLQDAPISRIDLLICRNTLMYFTADTQTRVLARLHYAISDGGYLFAGRAEMLLTHANLFLPLDARNRIFAKVPSPYFRARLKLFSQTAGDVAINHVGRQVLLREAAFDADSDAGLVVDSDGVLVMANDRARTGFGVAVRDIGRRLQDVEISYRPVELRSLIDQAANERRTVQVSGVARTLPNGTTELLDVSVTPLSGDDGEQLGAAITFKDVTSSSQLHTELARNRQELETAYEELQSTNEELETTNEELQSTVEELETTNEELQSANEELETMNEELQSTNGELQAINTELGSRTAEVDRLNAFIESVLGSLDAGIVALDIEQRVVVWNERSRDLWGLREDEVVGQPLMSLDIGLPVQELAAPIQECLVGDARQVDRVLEALTRRGRTITCRVTCNAVYAGTSVTGVVVMVEDLSQRSPAAGARRLG